MSALSWISIAAVPVVVLLSPYLCRLIACAALSWANALEAWRDELARQWRRNHSMLLAEPQPADAGNWTPADENITDEAASAGAAPDAAYLADIRAALSLRRRVGARLEGGAQ